MVADRSSGLFIDGYGRFKGVLDFFSIDVVDQRSTGK
jgi:hypothetical protein